MMDTQKALAAIAAHRAVAEKATKRPWHNCSGVSVDDQTGLDICYMPEWDGYDNAEFIALAANSHAALLDVAEAAVTLDSASRNPTACRLRWNPASGGVPILSDDVVVPLDLRLF